MAGHSCEGMIAVSSCLRHSRISIISCAQNPHTTRPPRARSSFGMNDFRSPGKCKTSLQDQELAASTATGNYSLFQMILDNALPPKMPWSSVPLLGLIVSPLRLLSHLLLLTARPQEAQELLLYILSISASSCIHPPCK